MIDAMMVTIFIKTNKTSIDYFLKARQTNGFLVLSDGTTTTLVSVSGNIVEIFLGQG